MNEDVRQTRYMAELDAQRQEQRAGAVAQKDAMQGLTSSEGWRIVAGFLRSQIEARQAQFFLEETGASEYKRGEIGALLLIERYPEVVLRAAQDALDSLAQEREQHGQTVRSQQRRNERTDPDADDTSGWTEADG
jgi:hypothetical protein